MSAFKHSKKRYNLFQTFRKYCQQEIFSRRGNFEMTALHSAKKKNKKTIHYLIKPKKCSFFFRLSIYKMVLFNSTANFELFKIKFSSKLINIVIINQKYLLVSFIFISFSFIFLKFMVDNE